MSQDLKWVLCRKENWPGLIKTMREWGSKIKKHTTVQVITDRVNVLRVERTRNMRGPKPEEIWVYGLWKAKDLKKLLSASLAYKGDV